MATLFKTVVIICLLGLCCSCTLKFKGKDIELETTTPDEIVVAEYRLNEINIL
ncbi:hypothetical protein LCGC14_1113840 [marine sediment metagenome]|uniref:Uncharacterized protein n=1 Tax=marine sediment metagenome TaxID=412755 RepID=A0A0F9PP29_9ZZZZ